MYKKNKDQGREKHYRKAESDKRGKGGNNGKGVREGEKEKHCGEVTEKRKGARKRQGTPRKRKEGKGGERKE